MGGKTRAAGLTRRAKVDCPNCGEIVAECLRHLPDPRRKRRPSNPKIDAADRAWAQAVKQRDGWRCRRCGKDPSQLGPGGLQAAHIVSRRYKATRHDLDNGVAICGGDHMYFHRNPSAFFAWIKAEFGPSYFDELYAKAQASTKIVPRKSS